MNLSIELLKARSHHVVSDELEGDVFKDGDFKSFLKTQGGGYYFDNSLHIYVSNTENNWNDIQFMNCLIEQHYGSTFGKSYFFGEDIFGNLFGFKNHKIVFSNIESGEEEIIANKFKEWLKVLFSDLNYFTGKALAISMERNEVDDLRNGFRLCPKYPFIIGGNYELENLYLKYYDKNLEYNSNIAKQVANLEDGQKVNLIIK